MTKTTLSTNDLRTSFPAVLAHLGQFTWRCLGDAPQIEVVEDLSLPRLTVHITGDDDGFPARFTHVENGLVLRDDTVIDPRAGVLWGGMEHLLWTAIDATLGKVPAYRLPRFGAKSVPIKSVPFLNGF